MNKYQATANILNKYIEKDIKCFDTLSVASAQRAYEESGLVQICNDGHISQIETEGELI